MAEDAGVRLIVVHRWHQRRSIPSAYDARLIEGAGRRGIALSAQELADARAPRDHTGHVVLDSQIHIDELVKAFPAREEAA